MTAHVNHDLVGPFIQFYQENYQYEIEELVEDYPDEQRSLLVDYMELYGFDSNLAEDFLAEPSQMIEYAEEALRQYSAQDGVKLGRAHVRLYNLPQTTNLREVSSRHLNELIQVLGRVESSSRIESALVEGAFECQRCGTMTYIPQTVQDRSEPAECQGCERKGPFRLNQDRSEYVDRQTVRVEQRIQGTGDDTDVESVVVVLEDDLAGSVSLGDSVRVAGLVRKIGDSEDYVDATIFDKRLDVVSVQTVGDDYHIEVSNEEVEQILKLAENEDVHQKITESIAPSVYGYSREKLAVTLQLFGGVTKQLPEGSRIRGDIHVLLVGDPGTARTTLLRYASRLAPRSVYTNGSQTSQVGLTAAATPSSGKSDPWELKSGVMVMASGGLACLDDFDAFSDEERRPLHEALETQELNVSKASVTETLSTKTSVLAAANPRYGRFDPYEPMGDQIDLDPGLITRFDLLFVVDDKVDPNEDAEIAAHVLDVNHAGELATAESKSGREVGEKAEQLEEEFSPPVGAELLRKYIAYTRRNCFPTMSESAKNRIKDFYVELRSQGTEEDAPVPVSARKLEALVRLAEASARIRLSDTVTDDDAERVVNLVRSSLRDIGIDPETEEFDADVVETGERTQPDTDDLKLIVESVEQEYEEGAPVDQVIERATSKFGINREAVEQEIENLKQKGEVYEPSLDHLRTT
jgi:replicative DNA helicase Mcm